jgi:serine/threonine protein kinase
MNPDPPRPAAPGSAYPYLSPPQQPDELGRLGPYRILAELGGGGMGTVFRADDPLLKRSVAIKVIRPDLPDREQARLRFLREAQTMAAFASHPHLITIHLVSENDGVPFLVMPLLTGQTLECLLNTRALPLSAHFYRLAREVALGLDALHRKGLVHRDIKPSNIWLRPMPDQSELADAMEGQVVLLDFGLARFVHEVDPLTRDRVVLGTLAYMPPEQTRSPHVDHRADLYSLGVVLFRMVSGQLPFPCNNLADLLLALTQQVPPPLTTFAADVPQALSNLVARLLEKRPHRRPDCTREVAEILQELEQKAGRSPAAKSEIPETCPSIDSAPVGLRLVVRRMNGDQPGEEVQSSGVPEHQGHSRGPRQVVLYTGERIRLEASISEPGYLTVLNLGPTGNLHLLYPLPAQDGVLPTLLAAQQTIRILEMELTPPAGTEKVFALWSRVPLTGSPRALLELARSAERASPVRDLRPEDRSTGKARPEGLHLAALELDHRPRPTRYTAARSDP